MDPWELRQSLRRAAVSTHAAFPPTAPPLGSALVRMATTAWFEHRLGRGRVLSMSPAGLDDAEATALWHALSAAVTSSEWGDDWEQVGCWAFRVSSCPGAPLSHDQEAGPPSIQASTTHAAT
eukprot:358445-Chlamydomonas_euryale.AAC.35